MAAQIKELLDLVRQLVEEQKRSAAKVLGKARRTSQPKTKERPEQSAKSYVARPRKTPRPRYSRQSRNEKPIEHPSSAQPIPAAHATPIAPPKKLDNIGSGASHKFRAVENAFNAGGNIIPALGQIGQLLGALRQFGEAISNIKTAFGNKPDLPKTDTSKFSPKPVAKPTTPPATPTKAKPDNSPAPLPVPANAPKSSTKRSRPVPPPANKSSGRIPLPLVPNADQFSTAATKNISPESTNSNATNPLTAPPEVIRPSGALVAQQNTNIPFVPQQPIVTTTVPTPSPSVPVPTPPTTPPKIPDSEFEIPFTKEEWEELRANNPHVDISPYRSINTPLAGNNDNEGIAAIVKNTRELTNLFGKTAGEGMRRDTGQLPPGQESQYSEQRQAMTSGGFGNTGQTHDPAGAIAAGFVKAAGSAGLNRAATWVVDTITGLLFAP